MKGFGKTAAVLMLFAWCANSADARWVWHKERGWIETDALPRETEQERYDYAIALMTDEKYESALVEFGRLIREFRGSEIALKSEVCCIECCWRMGKEWDAFRRAEKFFALHPDSQLAEEVLALEFRAGTKLLERGDKSGVRVVDAVLQRQPDGPLADDGYFEVGRYYQKQGYYDRAEIYYGHLIEKSPESEFAPRALLGKTVCALDGTRKDDKKRLAAVDQAKSNLEYYKEHYGKAPGAEDPSQYMRIASGLESAKAKYEIRFFYALLDYVQQNYSVALGSFSLCARKLRNSEIGGEARYYSGECLYQLGKYYAAFKAFEKFFTESPGHERQSEAAKRQFEICGLLKESDLKTAAWAYGQVVARSPYSAFADDAQMEAGNCNMELGNYQTAQTAYEALLKGYPDSEWFGAAIFQVGKCALEQGKLVNEGASLRLAAEERFEDYLTRYPTGIKVTEARECLKEIKEAKAQDAFKVAEFYLRVKKPAAALVYLELITRDFGDTKWAPRAEEKAKQIKGGEGKG